MTYNTRIINRFFYIFITIHIIIWTLVPTLTNQNLPLDTIEALAWGSNLEWGFNKHPPASAFFVETFYKIFSNRDWAYYLLSQIFLIFSFCIIFKFSEDFFKNKILGLVSVLLLEGIFFYNYTTPEFNVYISQLPFWTLTVYYSYNAIYKDEFKDWLLLGIFGAIGFLSHYLFSYLLISITILYLYIFFKDKKFNFKSLIALEVFIVMIIPHLIWLSENNYITVSYGLHRTGSGLIDQQLAAHIIYPLLFLLKQIGILIPFWIMLFVLLKKFNFKLRFKEKKFLFLFIINFLPIILIAITSLITGSKIKTMWLTPFYLYFGIFFIYLLKENLNLKKIRTFLISFLFFFILSPIIYSIISISQTDKRTDYPGKKIAIKTQYIWDQQFKSKINVVYGNEWNAGNLSYHLKSRPIWDGFIKKEKLDELRDYICLENVCVGSK